MDSDSQQLTEQRSSVQGVLLGLGLAYFGAYQLFKLPVVLPVLLEQYGYDRILAGGFMSVYAVAGLFLSVWIGSRVGRDGPFALIRIALALMALANLTTLLVPDSGAAMLLGRAVEGIAFAVLAISGPVLANQSAGTRTLPLVIGLTAMWIPTGQLTATLLSAASANKFGWQLLWHVGIVGCIAFMLWCRVFHARLRASQDASARGPIMAPATSPQQRRSLFLTAAIFLIWSGQYFAYMTWLPQYIIEVYEVDLGGALLSYLVPVVMLMIFNNVTGFALRAGVRVGWLLSGAMFAQVAVWCSLPWCTGPLAGVVSLVIYGIGAGIVPVCLFAMPSKITGGSSNTAGAFGIIMTGRNLGVLIGPILLAQLFKVVGGWSLVAPVFGSWTAIALVLAVLLSRRLH